MGKRAGAAMPLERAGQDVMETAGGDVVSALRLILARNAELERELALARVAVSSGFSCGWHKRLT